MFNLVISELASLNKTNKLITFSILSISLIFSLIAGTIFAIKELQTVYTYYIAFDMFQASILLFIEGIAIGVLLNLISKRKAMQK